MEATGSFFNPLLCIAHCVFSNTPVTLIVTSTSFCSYNSSGKTLEALGFCCCCFFNSFWEQWGKCLWYSNFIRRARLKGFQYLEMAQQEFRVEKNVLPCRDLIYASSSLSFFPPKRVKVPLKIYIFAAKFRTIILECSGYLWMRIGAPHVF